ncbi:universal stress protein [Octadecabacter sp. G9-8]|uniref:Universal stress protein n=1 Tax=Octadecabacter dasysiphoniae TaxID=2909341 RepID=A0ABS9CYS8_9RHOB|nr:universal stress protein [Octadecabacter dasysiphoniae]MCF2872427.1 universal stress protein [Octadecabacter dasysiphoniae]
MYKKILVPMALDHGVSPSTLDIARALTAGGGDVIALHVYEAPQGSVNAYLSEDAQKESVARARADLAAKTDHLEGVTAEMVIGHTYRSIIDYATDHGVDCIVMGSHKPGFSDYLLGSTAARVVRHAPCAVHVYRS